MVNSNSLELAGALIELKRPPQKYLCLVCFSCILHMLTYMLKEHGCLLEAARGLPDQFSDCFHQILQQRICCKAMPRVAAKPKRPAFFNSDQGASALGASKW